MKNATEMSYCYRPRCTYWNRHSSFAVNGKWMLLFDRPSDRNFPLRRGKYMYINYTSFSEMHFPRGKATENRQITVETEKSRAQRENPANK